MAASLATRVARLRRSRSGLSAGRIARCRSRWKEDSSPPNRFEYPSPRQVLDVREALVMEQFLPGNPYWCKTSDRLFNQPELRCFRRRLGSQRFSVAAEPGNTSHTETCGSS